MAARAALANQTGRGFREIVGVVVNAGKMDRTVTVKVGGLKWNRRVQKNFKVPKQHLVHDPLNSLRLGDVLAIQPGWRVSRRKRHVVSRLILPASGTPLEDRPPVPTEDERVAERDRKSAEKKDRKLRNKKERWDKRREEALQEKEKRRKLKAESFVHSGMGTLLREKGTLEEQMRRLGLDGMAGNAGPDGGVGAKKGEHEGGMGAAAAEEPVNKGKEG
ncbi:uncharacterized protein MKZ38_007492 [Zalerion maritima]|uniref:Ribosomal protein S17 n=1 Tax=Zalerion maritima TaxID=339359 RepID=A0AAD5RWR3_9PEZI|nr:uncharacterized protein MKZ38_007492 [Zalerion maritima]